MRRPQEPDSIPCTEDGRSSYSTDQRHAGQLLCWSWRDSHLETEEMIPDLPVKLQARAHTLSDTWLHHNKVESAWSTGTQKGYSSAARAAILAPSTTCWALEAHHIVGSCTGPQDHCPKVPHSLFPRAGSAEPPSWVAAIRTVQCRITQEVARK